MYLFRMEFIKFDHRPIRDIFNIFPIPPQVLELFDFSLQAVDTGRKINSFKCSNEPVCNGLRIKNLLLNVLIVAAISTISRHCRLLNLC